MMHTAPRLVSTLGQKTACLCLSHANYDSTMLNAAVVRILFLDMLRKLKLLHVVDLLTKSLSSSSSLSNTSTDLEVLERSIEQVSEMLDRVLTYVRSVIAGKTKGDPAIGRYLLDTFSTSTDGLDQGSFATSLQVRFRASSVDFVLTVASQDTLMVSYLANLIRSQAEVSSRLQLVTAS